MGRKVNKKRGKQLFLFAESDLLQKVFSEKLELILMTFCCICISKENASMSLMSNGSKLHVSIKFCCLNTPGYQTTFSNAVHQYLIGTVVSYLNHASSTFSSVSCFFFFQFQLWLMHCFVSLAVLLLLYLATFKNSQKTKKKHSSVKKMSVNSTNLSVTHIITNRRRKHKIN